MPGGNARRKKSYYLRLSHDQRGECFYCKVFMTSKVGPHPTLPTDWTFEHLLPASRGGRFIRENIVLACYRCNQDRGDREYFVEGSGVRTQAFVSNEMQMAKRRETNWRKRAAKRARVKAKRSL